MLESRRPRVRLTPLLFGGGQERGLRSGTLNTPGIVGMGKALEIAKSSAKRDTTRLSALSGHFLERLTNSMSGVVLNGAAVERLPNNLSLSIDGLEPLALIRRLRDKMSFSASSACSTDSIETSHVLIAMFGDTPRARNAFRIAPGRFTTQLEMEDAATMMIGAIEALRAVN